MLHEVLFALSGHPSPLFPEDGQQISSELLSLLSESETALLRSTGQLAIRHRKLRSLLGQIVAEHGSMICRAVATSILQIHLTRFQQKILSVEERILANDTSLVGAYKIVPLASVVGEFDGWHRLMSWYWDIACFMFTPLQPSSRTRSVTNGAMLINKLRVESKTGFPEIEDAATSLCKVSECAWMRQLSAWLLYGKIPPHGALDFFIKIEPGTGGGDTHFIKDRDLLPDFVSPAAASSILFIGKSLDQIRRHARKNSRQSVTGQNIISEAEIASVHASHLSSLTLPIQPAQLLRALSAIRLSLSKNVLQHLLPMEQIVILLTCFRQFFLLGRGEFAVALIDEAERRLQSRWHSMGRLLQQDPVKALQGLTIRDPELHETLNRTWRVLARDGEDGEDQVLDFAVKHTVLAAPIKHNSRPSTSDSTTGIGPQISAVAFNDLLFPSATLFQINIESPFDLFISTRETDIYSSVNAYLIAIRRAQVRLAELWRRGTARRGYPTKGGLYGNQTSTEFRRRINQRNKNTRKVWATCSAANFLVSETAAYFEGEIIRESCMHFENWVKSPSSSDTPDDSTSGGATERETGVTQRDPETLAAGHRSFLAALVYALLLTDVVYTRELRSLLGNLDTFVAMFNNLLDSQLRQDLELGVDNFAPDDDESEQRMVLQLDRARKKVDSDLKSVVSRLRQLDHERIGAARYFNSSVVESGSFEPWKGGGVDRLLMKLEFGRMVERSFDLVSV
ncbi:hypothetical protein M433DRAFT_192742 [Acidomyces richmondensis BFW]|nr:MAG: hypothetical protein FE78DRAFT_33419 [Acidomyces sp. 'richmondensis']KYG46636.1 hypothetical protein M433DRAFT_192742 [Acidomyces richmondensis BFW]